MEEVLPASPDDAVATPAARRPIPLKLYLVGVSLPVLVYIAVQAATHPAIQDQLRAGAPWIVALFFIEMFPVPVWRDLRVSLGFPLVLFMGVLFDPVAVALFVLLGSGDPREFTGDSDLLRAVFNRCQVALAALASTAVLHALAPDPHFGPLILGAALAASIANLTINMSLVAAAAHLDYGRPLREVLRGMVLGSSWPLQAVYVGLGLLGVAMALVYREIGAWALVGLLPPLLAIRPLLGLTNRLRRTEANLERETTRNEVAEQIAEERRHERERVAAILHDELSPLLTSAKLRLEASVARANGALTEPADEILSSLSAAHRQVRSLIRELLGAPSGPGGLVTALQKLFDDLRGEHEVTIHDSCQPVEATVPVEDLLYSITREAARNALRHGRAGTLRIGLREVEGEAILSISDDGTGFDTNSLDDADGHYGITLLQRRATMCGGRVSVSSSPGQGTLVTARIPLSTEAHEAPTTVVDVSEGRLRGGISDFEDGHRVTVLPASLDPREEVSQGEVL